MEKTMRCLMLVLAMISFSSTAMSQSVTQAACLTDCPDQMFQIASVEGRFEGAALISPKAAPDRFAALEQQRWRELRYDVLADVVLHVDLALSATILPDNWPGSVPPPNASARYSIHSSDDGENFTPVKNKTRLAKGSYISILVSQATAETEAGAVSFFPVTWQITLSAQPTKDTPNTWSLLRETQGTRALGCAQLGCGAFDASLEAPEVSGTTDLPSVADLPGTPELSKPTIKVDETARELQTELARVGCYTGAIDGLWGPASRKAMTEFNRQNGSAAPVQDATPKALVAVARVGNPVCMATE